MAETDQFIGQKQDGFSRVGFETLEEGIPELP